MATVARNNIIREVAPKSLFESALPVLSASVTFNQGDLIAFDPVNYILRAVTGQLDSANILGVAPNTVVNGLMPSPIQGTAVDASQAIEDMKGPVYGVVAQLYLKTGDSFKPGQPVYLSGIDAQTVTSAVTGSSIGLFNGKAVTSAASGSFGDVLVGARYNLGSDLHV